MPAEELPINTSARALQMAEAIFGEGMTVVGASYRGDPRSSGIFSDGDAVAPDLTPGDTGVILSTGRTRSVTNSSGAENQSGSTSTNTSGANNLPDFNAVAGARTYDASHLDVDFIPEGETLTMQFVFGSEEFPEFQNSVYQDFVGVWVNGRLAQIEVGTGDTDPDNINAVSNENLFIDNSRGLYNTEMDGFTVTLTLNAPVIPDQVNSIRIGIADVFDTQYDSVLLVAGKSVQTALVAVSDEISLNPSGSETLDVLANDTTSGGSLTITHINNVPVMAGDKVTLATGGVVSLNADGTLTIAADDSIENHNFTYAISDGFNSDTGIVNVSHVPCFVAGTLIGTPEGERAVETLKPGDLVLTKDDGAVPVRWVGCRTVVAAGRLAPIWIKANTFGAHKDLMVSPLHRVLIRDALAELLFGEDEVLVAARDLINDRSVLRREGGEVSYVHLLFDRHQVVYSAGLATESFLPGPQTQESFAQEALNEIQALFPGFDPETGSGYGHAARRGLRPFEAQVLVQQWRAA